MLEEKDVVYVGKKDLMTYVMSVLSRFQKDAKKVTVKARGRAISRAVDIAEVARNRFMQNIKVSTIQIGSKAVEREGRNFNVSEIEIVLEV